MIYGKIVDKSSSGFGTKRICRSNGHTWDYFDISGHTFLLSWSVYLVIAELLDPAREFFKKTHSFILEMVTLLAIAWNGLLVILWIVMLGKAKEISSLETCSSIDPALLSYDRRENLGKTSC
jgi:hypothetical protein